MARCKKCNATISRLDSDICPFCGEKNPISTSYETMDMTSFINTQEGSDVVLAKSKKKNVFLLLHFILGFVGAGYFYGSFILKGIACILVSGLYFGGLALILYFFAKLGVISFIIPLALLPVINIALGIYNMLDPSPKDKKGDYFR